MPRALTKEEFIKKSISVHGNLYDYSKLLYKTTHDKVEIICLKHGSFNIAAFRHLKGKGCQLCTVHQLTNDEFIGKANYTHNNKYDYSLVNYIRMNSKVKIICPEHGEFIQTPDRHLNSGGCFKCGVVLSAKNRTYTTEEFIARAKEIHDEKYDYSTSFYFKGKTPISIICSEHGIFNQTPDAHISGKGCIKCSESKGEKEITKILKLHEIKFESQKKFEECKKKLPLPFDFYLPEKNVCIEFDGEQHYKPVEWFGGLEGFLERKENDKIKETFCKNKRIKLIRIKNGQNIYERLKKYIA
ncbi:MAG: hypothetical protein KA007_00475 [Candidatus Pacebacteria bacterium]|jgi:very-short-patch-repair endonuclease|nr:hypothetical protein [Candidatus Paceibacterota bacterium]OQA64760.1 MAG: hypothetical protein BWY38_02954 [Ignavibacteria bacterium ADurb.Bin266]